MDLRRRTLLGSAVSAGLVSVAGCRTGEDRPSAQEALTWLRGVDGVTRARWIENDEDTTGHSFLLTFDAALGDRAVRRLVDTLKDGFEKRDGYRWSVRVELGTQAGRFYPGTVRAADDELDVDRMLWLRSDGRATSSAYDAPGVGGLMVTAPRADVAGVALGLDALGQDDTRTTHLVASADRSMAVQWSVSSGLGFRLDRDEVERFARLQARYPGLGGYLMFPDRRAAFWFATDDLPLDTLLSRVDDLVRPDTWDRVELGWGVGRAAPADFRRVFSGPARTLLERLDPVAGVTALRSFALPGAGDAELDQVVVSSGAGLVRAVAEMRDLLDRFVQVSLSRGPARYVGNTPDEVLTTSANAEQREIDAAVRVADLTAVRKFATVGTRGQLIVDVGIGDAELHTATDALVAGTVRPRVADFWGSVPEGSDSTQGYRLVKLGDWRDGDFVADARLPRSRRGLERRVEAAWRASVAAAGR